MRAVSTVHAWQSASVVNVQVVTGRGNGSPKNDPANKKGILQRYHHRSPRCNDGCVLVTVGGPVISSAQAESLFEYVEEQERYMRNLAAPCQVSQKALRRMEGAIPAYLKVLEGLFKARCSLAEYLSAQSDQRLKAAKASFAQADEPGRLCAPASYPG